MDPQPVGGRRAKTEA